jgi:alanine-synthesizing transaminase
VTFSDRVPRHVEANALTRALAALRARGTPILDLTESNPTHIGIEYPADLLDGLSNGRGLSYDPQPFGLKEAREAVAADCRRRDANITPEQVVLSASTSEMYSWLFKLLCDPGTSVLVPQPSYPLFEHLTRLEGVRAAPYHLEYHGRWEIDFASLAAAPIETRALLVVSPNNPTGSMVSTQELDRLVEVCRDRGWALVVDEVFADYRLDAGDAITDVSARADVLSFSLGGVSKALGLPQVKVGWSIVGGPSRERADALAGLELIADTFLSVGTPVQLALPDLLRRGGAVRDAVHQRVRCNLDRIRRIAREFPSCDVLRVEGGWSAVVRLPATRDEESLTLELLRHEGILVHPGYFFDFPHEAFIVVSLLPPEDVFDDAVRRAFRFATS